MGILRRTTRRATKAPGVPQARHVAERAVAPYLRADLHALGLEHTATTARLADLEQKVEHLVLVVRGDGERLNGIEQHMPTVLNAIASSNGTARLLARDVGDLRRELADVSTAVADALRLEQQLDDARRGLASTAERLEDAWAGFQLGDDDVRAEMRPHIDTLGWLLNRVETIRAEMMHELRYGSSSGDGEGRIEAKVVNPSALGAGPPRLNLGAGHLPIDGYVNVDMRELPGIDVVAAVDDLPFEPGSVAEIFSSHTIEHFPHEQLRRRLLPYWRGLLQPKGVFRAVVPDVDAMTRAYVDGELSFDTLRSVVYGGQEYEGDFHFTGFTGDSLAQLLTAAGFEDPQVVAAGRPNGDCLELEIRATRPAD